MRHLIDLHNEFEEYNKITEVLKDPVKYLWLRKEGNRQIATFKYEEYMFAVHFTRLDQKWNISFKPETKNGKKIEDNFDWMEDLLNIKTLPIKLFSTVIAIIRDWIKREDPKEFLFVSEDPKREKLYLKIINFIKFDTEYEKKKEGLIWVFTKEEISEFDYDTATNDEIETIIESNMFNDVRKYSDRIKKLKS